MSTTTLERTAPGWYRDPAGLADLRWYDGVAWTSQTSSADAPRPAAPTPSPAPAPAVPSTPARVESSGPGSGWYPDPAGSNLLRFFDGQRWTERVAPVPVSIPSPSAPVSLPAAPAQPAAVSAPEALQPGVTPLRAPSRRALRPAPQVSVSDVQVEDEETAPAAPRLSPRTLRRVGSLVTLVGVVACLYAFWVVAGSNMWGDWTQRNLREEMAAAAPAPVVSPVPDVVGLDGSPVQPAVPVPATSEAAPAPAPAPVPVAPVAPYERSVPALPGNGTAVGTIRIPSIGVDEVFVAGTEVPDLKKGPGVWRDGVFPGTPGNATISGHRTTYGAPFRRIDELKTGDRIIVSVAGHPDAVFEVRGQEVVSPDHVEVTYPTPGVRLTLTTCDPVGSAAKRRVIQAELVEGAWVDKAIPSEGWTFQK